MIVEEDPHQPMGFIDTMISSRSSSPADVCDMVEQELHELLSEPRIEDWGALPRLMDGRQHAAQSPAFDDARCPTNDLPIADTTARTSLKRSVCSAQLDSTDRSTPTNQVLRQQLAETLAPDGVHLEREQDSFDNIAYKPFQGAYSPPAMVSADKAMEDVLERAKAVLLSTPSPTQVVDLTRSGLPSAHVKRIAKQEACMGMVPKLSPCFVSAMSHACRIFIKALTARAHQFMTRDGRMTMQMLDIVRAMDSCEKFDFLIDVVQQCAPNEVLALGALDRESEVPMKVDDVHSFSPILSTPIGDEYGTAHQEMEDP